MVALATALNVYLIFTNKDKYKEMLQVNWKSKLYIKSIRMNLNSILSILFASIVLISFIIFFVKVSIKIRRGGGSIPYFISSGAMDATLNKEKKAATEVIVESNAHKKMEEQSSFDPPEKDQIDYA